MLTWLSQLKTPCGWARSFNGMGRRRHAVDATGRYDENGTLPAMGASSASAHYRDPSP